MHASQKIFDRKLTLLKIIQVVKLYLDNNIDVCGEEADDDGELQLGHDQLSIYHNI